MATNNSDNYRPTQFNVQTGGANGTLNNVAPGATSGVPMIGQGVASQPIFGTAAIAGGGTNATSFATSNGLVKYDGTRLVTSSAALLDSNNVYTNASQPTVEAYLSAGVTNVTGDSTSYTPIFDFIPYNVGSYYNPATGIFTCATAGLYLVCFNFTMLGLTASHTGGFTIIDVASSNGSVNRATNSNPFAMSAAGVASFTYTTMLRMLAAGTINPQVIVTGGAKVVGLQGSSGGRALTTLTISKIS